MVDDLPFTQPPDDPTRPAREPRKCWRHEWLAVHLCDDARGRAEGMWHVAQVHTNPAAPCHQAMRCVRCGKVRDETIRLRNKRNRSRGLAIQRKRIQALGGTNLAGNNENLDGIGLLFRYESKSGGAFSERVWRWLTGIPKLGDQTGVLIVTETPGPGRKARSYVVVEYDEWRSLHGEQREEA